MCTSIKVKEIILDMGKDNLEIELHTRNLKPANKPLPFQRNAL
jgi:hypothetical protein